MVCMSRSERAESDCRCIIVHGVATSLQVDHHTTYPIQIFTKNILFRTKDICYTCLILVHIPMGYLVDSATTRFRLRISAISEKAYRGVFCIIFTSFSVRLREFKQYLFITRSSGSFQVQTHKTSTHPQASSNTCKCPSKILEGDSRTCTYSVELNSENSISNSYDNY